MPSLNIKIGASVDRNLAVAYRPLVEGAKRAAATILAEQRKAAKEGERETKRSEREKERAFEQTAKQAARWQKEQLRALEKAEKDKVRETERSAAAMQKIRERSATMAGQLAARQASEEVRAARRADAERQRDVEKRLSASKKAQDRANAEGFGIATRAGRAFIGVSRAVAGKALSVAGTIARSQGVDLDLGSIFSKNANLETLATQVSNSGYMGGDKRNGRRVATDELMRDALSVGTKTGTGANEIMEGLSKFVGLTGDLKTGRELLEQMAVLSKATGSSFEDMAAAAGNITMNLPEKDELGNVIDKGKTTALVLKAVAGMGKVGAVEIKDLASQMAKLAASAGMFEGDASKNMITLAAMAQESRATGGSASATQAATSVASFVSMLKTPARAKAFEHATGTKVYDPKTGKLRDPQTIIKEALANVGTDPLKLKAIFANVQGSRAMEGFATKFRDAGGGKAGLDAVDAEFDRLKKAAMADEEIAESFARAMKTGQSQAEVFNNQMSLTALEMQKALLPAIQALAPEVVKATQEFSKAVTYLMGVDVKKNVDESMERADTALKSARVQVAGGKISDATADELAKSEIDTKSASALAKSDLSDAEKNKTGDVGRAFYKAIDWLPAMQGINLIGGGSIGEGVGHAKLDREDVDIQSKRWTAEDAERKHQEMVQANKDLKLLLERGIVVKVSNISDLKDGAAPPGAANPGVRPSPEQKAGAKR